jgi:hypothetical protein
MSLPDATGFEPARDRIPPDFRSGALNQARPHTRGYQLIPEKTDFILHRPLCHPHFFVNFRSGKAKKT